MRQRSLGLTLFGGLAIIVAACGGGATTEPLGRGPGLAAGRVGPGVRASIAGRSVGIGCSVVRGAQGRRRHRRRARFEDKSFNQSSNEGAQDAATAIGGEHDVIVTKQVSDYASNIQSFVDQGYDVIVTIGFLIGTDTAKAAKANPDVTFIGVDQGVCVDETGAPDPTFACKGDAATLLPNYQGIVFAEAQPGYLAGIVAAGHRDRHDQRRRRHERPGRRQLLARL